MINLKVRDVPYRPSMIAVAVLAMIAPLALGACELSEPYVYDSAAYDREHVDFAKPPKTLSAVQVCYSKYGTKQAEVVKLAADRCAKYGAGIRFSHSSYVDCPMLTPVGAVFECTGAIAVKPSFTGSGVARSSGPSRTPGQPGTPLVGFHEGERPMGVLFGRSPTSPATTVPSALPEAPPSAPVQPSGQK
ncbi:MAG: hypothetical protein RIB80_14650 [Rhodospirillales bacterium]